MYANKFSLLLPIICLFILSSEKLKSQSVIRGMIEETNGNPLQSANVLLLKFPDSSLVKGAISDVSGKYRFENVANGKYLVTATFTGMNQVYSSPFEIDRQTKDVNLDILYLASTNLQLKSVVVAVKKPMFEQKIDRMVINVKNGITNAGGSALDVLEKSPGVSVNRQNNSIAVNGKNGVMVMINGKVSYMPMEALVQLLAATSGDNIEKIELITTPPSKYDAEGNAGYINIVMINNPYSGISGSYFVNAGYGKKELGGSGINFNNRNAKINLYGNYSFRYIHYIQPSTGFTQFARSGDIIRNISFSDRDAITKLHDVRIGLDYQVDASTVIGVLAGGFISHWTMDADNGAVISKNNVADTTINTFNREINHWDNVLVNLNLQHTFKPRQILYLDANYIYYRDDNPNIYSNKYIDAADELLYREDLKSGKRTPINFRVFSTDYTSPLGKNTTIESGAKISLSKFTNDVTVDNLKQGIYVADSALSAKYFLKENIAAAYVSFTFNAAANVSVKAGLRYEYTTSNLTTAEISDIVDRKYGELFPTFYISHKLNDENNISVSYSRRITRPSFNDLAPFTIFFDPKTFFAGNPSLQPAIANSIEGRYAFKNFAFSLSYTRESNTIESFYFQTNKIDTVKNILYLSASNFNSEKFIATSLSLPITVTGWWNMQNNIVYHSRQVNTINNNKNIRFHISDYNLSSTQRFNLKKDLSLDLMGFYYSGSFIGTTKFKALYQLNVGLQKKMTKKDDVLRFTANDIFNSASNYIFTDNLSIPGSIVKRSFNFGLVAYKLSYTHNFGNKGLKGRRERTIGAEDELNRVHN